MKKTKLPVRERILNYLWKGHEVDAKTLSRRIKANYNSVRRELGYLMRRGSVFYSLGGGAKGVKGYYTSI
jgi:predicted ArsR family transcriptional regulator